MTWSGARVTRARAWWAARILELERAGKPIRCPFCDQPVTLDQPWDVDHAEKRADGGALWSRDNQRPAHRACNQSDGASYGNRRRSPRGRRIRG